MTPKPDIAARLRALAEDIDNPTYSGIARGAIARALAAEIEEISSDLRGWRDAYCETAGLCVSDDKAKELADRLAARKGGGE